MPKKTPYTEAELKMPEERFGYSDPLPKSSHLGIVLGVLILMLTCILIGLYLWAMALQNNLKLAEEIPQNIRPTAEENNEPESTNAEADVEMFQTLSTSDEITAIDADLQNTKLETFDGEMTAIDAEMQ